MRKGFVIVFFMLLAVASQHSMAQLTNTGELYVSQGTSAVTSGAFSNAEGARFTNAGELIVHGEFRNTEEATNGGALTAYGEFRNTGFGSFTNEGELRAFADFSNEENASFTNDGRLYLHADFSNEGLVDYREAGLTSFSGTTQKQRLQGKGATYFRNLVFNNTFSETPFLLSDTITVEGTVAFEQGIVDSDTYAGIFVFEEAAGYTGASRQSHIDGPVVKRGDRSFTYPVGDQQFYRSASLSEPEDPSEKYETKYFKENSDKFYPHALKEGAGQQDTSEGKARYGKNSAGKTAAGEWPAGESSEGLLNYINEGEYWRVTPVTGKSELLLTLSWDESTTPDEIWRNPESVHVVRWDVERNLWVDEGGTVNKRERTITTKISDYGIFTLGTVAQVEEELPCEVVVYNAVSPNGDASNEAFVIEAPAGVGPVSVKIFNRWGAKVFERTNYGEGGNLFRGYSEAGSTIGNGKLPEGTYFYTLEYSCGNAADSMVSKAGYLYLSHNE